MEVAAVAADVVNVMGLAAVAADVVKVMGLAAMAADASDPRCREFRTHTPSLIFRHLPPNSARIGNAVSALQRFGYRLIRLWKQHSVVRAGLA